MIEDNAFYNLVLARLVEPTSMLDTPRVLHDVGAAPAHRNTYTNALRRAQDRQYRE